MMNDPRDPSPQSSDPGRPPRHEIPSDPPIREIPAKPSRDVPQPDRERAENEGMISHPPPHGGTKASQPVEGEGSYTAARRYRKGLESSVKQGNSEELAAEAAEALDGPEGQELRQAEQKAKRGHGPTPSPKNASAR